MPDLSISDSCALFTHAGTVAGRYHYLDSPKPYFHPLNTPAGHCVTLASPHDHKHHKGLMYALRAEDVNFWEEWATLKTEVVGKIQHVDFSEITPTGDAAGFLETLHWSALDGSLPTFDEERRITLRVDESGSFLWEWSTRLVALRDIHLVHSQWAFPHDDGRRTNYHGLGLRLPREFGGATGNYRLILDGVEVDEKAAMGTSPVSARYEGSFDGIWPVPRAAVTLSQNHGHTLYAMTDYMAWMSMGPTNRKPMRLSPGDEITEHYSVRVEDLGPSDG